MRPQPEGEEVRSAAQTPAPLRILVVGLEDSLAEELARALCESSTAEVRIVPRHAADEWLARWPRGADAPADVIFCPAINSTYRRILAAHAQPDCRTPVIVVSGCDDYAGWLEAMEAGAHDYCVPPFEKRQIGWILAGLRAGGVTLAAEQKG